MRLVMGNLYDKLNEYFENTPQELLDKDLKEFAYLNNVGPDVMEYAESVKEHFADKKSVVASQNKQNLHRFRWAGVL